jgi:hypothetical protein
MPRKRAQTSIHFESGRVYEYTQFRLGGGELKLIVTLVEQDAKPDQDIFATMFVEASSEYPQGAEVYIRAGNITPYTGLIAWDEYEDGYYSRTREVPVLDMSLIYHVRLYGATWLVTLAHPSPALPDSYMLAVVQWMFTTIIRIPALSRLTLGKPINVKPEDLHPYSGVLSDGTVIENGVVTTQGTEFSIRELSPMEE